MLYLNPPVVTKPPMCKIRDKTILNLIPLNDKQPVKDLCIVLVVVSSQDCVPTLSVAYHTDEIHFVKKRTTPWKVN